MSWWALRVTPRAPQRETVAAWLVLTSGQAVEEREDGSLVAVLGSEELLEATRQGLEAKFGSLPIEQHQVADVDWGTAWREGLAARSFGRLVVAPTWVDHDPAAGKVVVRLDPEMAFGSGEHGSTRVALALLVRHLRPGQRVLDLGTGSGILAIAARRLGASWAAGIDIDEESLPVAIRNAERNEVPDIGFIAGDAANLAPLLGPVDVVVANILRLINEALLPEIIAALAPGGLALFSGMEATEAPQFLPRLQEAGMTVVDEVTDEGWWGVGARRP